jgi:hypothetical protein
MWMYIVIYGTTGGPTQVSPTAQQQKNLVWKGQLKTSSGHGKDKLALKGRKGRVEEPKQEAQGDGQAREVG